MLVETIEGRGPSAAVGDEPVVELPERLDVQLVDAPLSVGTGDDEPGVAEDPQVLRDRRLAQPGAADQLPDGRLAVDQSVQDLPAVRLGEDGKRIEHRRI